MATTLYVNPSTWDLDIDARGNIATATGPYQLAQDAASAIKTFLGEVYLDTTIGVSGILGEAIPMVLLKSKLAAAALTVPGVASAKVFITSVVDRTVSGQVQITDAAGAMSAAAF